MRLAVEREQDIEHAGQHGRDPVVEADPVGAFQGALELVAVRGQRIAQDRVVLGDDGPHQGLRVGDAGPRLERGVPLARIDQRPGRPHVVPESRAVTHPGLAAIQHPRQIGLDPGHVAKHHVEVDAGGRVDPLVARLPEGIADLGARMSPRRRRPARPGTAAHPDTRTGRCPRRRRPRRRPAIRPAPRPRRPGARHTPPRCAARRPDGCLVFGCVIVPLEAENSSALISRVEIRLYDGISLKNLKQNPQK